MGHPVAHALQALQRPGQDLAPPVAQRRTTHGTGPGRAARGDARRVGGDLALALFIPLGGQDLQVDGDVRTRRQEDGVRVAAPNEAPEGIGVRGQKGLTDGAEAVDEKSLRISVV
jgi:hypothetical protein